MIQRLLSARRALYCLLVFAIVGCEPTITALPTEAAVVNTPLPTHEITFVPTANPLPSRTATLPPTETLTPTNTLIPSQTFTPSNTPTETLTPSPTLTPSQTFTPSRTFTRTRAPSITPSPSSTSLPTNIVIASPTRGTPNGTIPPTWTPPPPNPAVQIADHYMMGRPLSNDAANYANRTYPYGGTSGGRLQVHHGVDMVNPRGTPILAAADGVVLHAGDDLATLFGPYNNYYGNLVVIQHTFAAPDGQPVYSLYGHMDRTNVITGQNVRQGEVIGVVGGTGIAQGPHLHFEVRVGDAYSFDATRNPELWIRPYPTFGTLAGQVTDANGTRLYSVTLNIESETVQRYAFSYTDDTVNPDTVFNENFVLGDLPSGYYTIFVSDNGRVRFTQIVYIYANRTTWLDVQLR